MNLISDILLLAAALGAGIYCIVLSRRLSRFNSLEDGMGGAIAVLSSQVDGMTKTLKEAQATAGAEREALDGLTNRAEGVAKRLELLVASMHDLPVETGKAADSDPQPEAEIPDEKIGGTNAKAAADHVTHNIFSSSRNGEGS